MAEYRVIDQDTIEIIAQNTQVVRLSELENELANIQRANQDAEELLRWRESLQQDKQQYVVLLPLQDTADLEAQINILRGVINGNNV
ncbi:MAG: hypothetical protein HF312_15445 [Ignavibacteria bacterium]|jgi:hypothetical protein|nr:hypothetical protein [Ignavibacteria bacterium]